ncbi:MAG: class A beta-lactamase-related serine hydrolase [Dehalococcoidia bacterium]|nr:class A beta-lactamase-related serine hydrolase [Dehalococcoidia bacterium]
MVNTKANDQVKALLDKMVKNKEEVGLQVAAYLDGELVVDCWAGLADSTTNRKVDGDTLFTVFSTTKGITATCIHMLADRGKLDYDAPIAKYWPEFAQKGKAKATVRHGLTHSVGLPLMPDGITTEKMCDWDWMCKTLAETKPMWEPGTKTGYHAYTYGWILGEVLRRVDGRTIGKFVQEEICKPLGMTDIYIGIPGSVEKRVARLENAPVPPGAPVFPADSLIFKAIPPIVGTTGEVFNRPDVRRASIPGAGGIMSARALARHYAALAGGGTLGKAKLMSSKRVDIARTKQTEDTDFVIGMPITKAMGYFLGGAGPMDAGMGPSPKVFGHAGAGGSNGFADPEHKFAFGFAKTLLKGFGDPPPPAAAKIADAIRAALGLQIPAGVKERRR